LDWRTKVELFEEIRREYEFGIGTIAGVAKKLKVHRRMVREAIGSALPTPRKKTERPRCKLAGAAAFVDGISPRPVSTVPRSQVAVYYLFARSKDRRALFRLQIEVLHDRRGFRKVTFDRASPVSAAKWQRLSLSVAKGPIKQGWSAPFVRRIR